MAVSLDRDLYDYLLNDFEMKHFYKIVVGQNQSSLLKLNFFTRNKGISLKNLTNN